MFGEISRIQQQHFLYVALLLETSANSIYKMWELELIRYRSYELNIEHKTGILTEMKIENPNGKANEGWRIIGPAKQTRTNKLIEMI